MTESLTVLRLTLIHAQYNVRRHLDEDHLILMLPVQAGSCPTLEAPFPM